jgi:acyl dehydratase
MRSYDDVVAMFPVGSTATLTRKVTFEMIKNYADLVGDHDPIHVDLEFCRSTQYGRPIAHGTLIVGFMSSASTLLTQNSRIPIVSLGYDRIRQIGPVFADQTVKTTYTVVKHCAQRQRIYGSVQSVVDNTLVADAMNILKIVN